MTIHVHKTATYRDAKYVLVDPARNAALFVYNTEFDQHAKDLIAGAGWVIDDEVGEYLCTLDELHTKHPELFI